MKSSLVILLILKVFLAIGQPYYLNKKLLEKNKKDFLGCNNEIFGTSESLSIYLGTPDFASSFSEMEDDLPRTPEYLTKLMDSISVDSLNTSILEKIGSYYDHLKDIEKSKKYYGKALKNINIKYFENDSASFYGHRSFLKFKLGITGFVDDTEKALSLNPNEAMAHSFYPAFLLSRGDFEKAETWAIHVLNKSDNPLNGILLLALTKFYEQNEELHRLIQTPKNKDELKQKHFKELIDWMSVKKHYNKINNQLFLDKLDKLFMLFPVLIKASLSNRNENNKVFFNFNTREKNDLEKLENWLLISTKNKTLNEYTAYKCLGLVNFFLQDKEEAIGYHQKALKVFPKNKKNLNQSDTFSNLLFIYMNYNRKDEYESLILNHIAENKIKSVSDHINLAKFYLLEGPIEKARFYIAETEKIDPNNFDVYRLKAQADFLEESDIKLDIFYMHKASRLAKNDDDYYRLYLQGAIYDMFNNNPNEAINKLNIIKKNNKDCETCDRLISTYFKIED